MESRKLQKVRATCILDCYHTCTLGEMETWIQYDDETFEKYHHFFLGHDIMMVLGGVSHEGASP